jgi:hypothetical protein
MGLSNFGGNWKGLKLILHPVPPARSRKKIAVILSQLLIPGMITLTDVK